MRVGLAMSREAFSGSHAVAQAVIEMAEADGLLGDSDWCLFDQELVDKVLEDHQLPKRLAQYMPEDRDREFSGLINELVGLHPSLWDLFRDTCDTIYRLGKMGHVILIGRGAHIVTRSMPHILRVRIVRAEADRIEEATKREGIDSARAARLVKQEDAARAAFVKSHFVEDIGDPQRYDMVLNTSQLGTIGAARVIITALQDRAGRLGAE